MYFYFLSLRNYLKMSYTSCVKILIYVFSVFYAIDNALLPWIGGSMFK